MARLLVTLAVMPAVLLSQVTAEAILIHDHHGHAVHPHALTLNELDAWKNNPEHKHEEHEHDGQPADPTTEDSDTILIVFDLPEALPRVPGLSTGSVFHRSPAPSPHPIAATLNAVISNPSLYERPWSHAPSVRAGRTVVSILLSNHALLL